MSAYGPIDAWSRALAQRMRHDANESKSEVPWVEHEGEVERSTESERFRRESRLRSSQDFQRVRRRGRRQQGQWIILAYARRVASPPRPAAEESAEQAHPASPLPVGDGPGERAARLPTRIGFSVSKQVGGAVQRNRVKRRLREAIRRRLWKTQPGWDMIVIARPEAAKVDYADLAAELAELLARARLLR